MARLVILTEGMKGRALELGANPVTIGRTEDNTFQIFEPSISTHHCQVALRGTEAVVKDLGSTNGTYIAGAKITEGILSPGQHLRLGDVELQFETGAVPTPAQVPAGGRRKTHPIVWAATAIAATVLLGLGFLVATKLLFPHHKVEIGWWKFDEASGDVAKDSSGNGHDGKLIRNPKRLDGKSGGAIQFNGHQYVLLGNIYQDKYDQLSIACWIRHLSTSWESIVERSVWDNPDGIGLWADYSGKAAAFGHYGDACVKSRATVQDNHWHHLVGTLAKSGDNYIYTIYVDGKLDNTATNAIGLEATTNPWTIGSRYDDSWGYRGVIDDVRIYDHALTPDEVRKLYQP
jgi:hypothetical protein